MEDAVVAPVRRRMLQPGERRSVRSDCGMGDGREGGGTGAERTRLAEAGWWKPGMDGAVEMWMCDPRAQATCTEGATAVEV